MKRRFVMLAASALSASLALAQAGRPAANPALAGNRNVALLFSAGRRDIEKQLVPLVLAREASSGPARSRLEAQLDLQVIVRWLSGLKAPDDDRAAVQYLRLQQAQDVVANLTKAFSKDSDAEFNNVQQNAAKQLHQLSYDLPATPSNAQLDEICRNVGLLVMDLAAGEAADPARVPPMRPASLPPDIQEAVAAIEVEPSAQVEPSRSIPYLSVSKPLRQQLLATLEMIERPAAHNLDADGVRELRQLLDDAVAISAGLAGNAGVSPDDREKLEQQLTEALALASDRRLRDMGTQRIADMARYRQVLGSITKLNLSDANYRLLAPAFEYAQKTPGESKQVLASVERFVAYCTIFDRMPATITYAAKPAIARTVQRPYDEIRKAFAVSRSEFLAAVESLGAGTISGSTSADLEDRVDAMRISLDVIDSLQSIPEALDTFSPFKVKSVGGLERRITSEASTAAGPGKGPVRHEAATVLKDLVRIAKTVRDLQGIKVDDAELAVLNQYTGKDMAAFEAKWRANVTAILDSAAAGARLDSQAIARNDMLLPLMSTLRSLAAFEQRIQQADALSRWADWGLTARATEQLIAPYRSAATKAFVGFLYDNTNDMRNWPSVQQERRLITNFVLRSIGGATTIAEPSSPLHLACAKMMTPMAQPIYGDQRVISLCAAAMSLPDADDAANQSLGSVIEKRLKR